MKIWIHLNGIQQGPYDFDQLAQIGIAPDTPVWYEGLPHWMPAESAPATSPLFAKPAQPATPPPTPQQQAEAAEQSEAEPKAETEAETTDEPDNQPVARHTPPPTPQQQIEAAPKKPTSYIALSIILTVLCCSPIAIAAIITGANSTSRYNAGDYAGAKRMSDITEWLIIITIAAGCLTIPFGWTGWIFPL